MVNVVDAKNNLVELALDNISSVEYANSSEGLLYIIELKDGSVIDIYEDDQGDGARAWLFEFC